jgi:hypothetical protein
LLPSKGGIPEFIRNEVRPFLKRIAENSKKADEWEYNQQGIQLIIRYNPNEQQFSGGGWIHYGVPYSPNHNPLFKALKTKADQLRKCGWEGLRGIIICDGNCTALGDRSPNNGAFGCKQIVERFFDEHRRTVSFVLVLEVKQQHRTFPQGYETVIQPKLFWNARHDFSHERTVANVFNRMLNAIPRLARTPLNALHHLAGRNPGYGDSFYGGFSMNGNEIKISARTLVELLAGRLEQQRFLEDHNLIPTKERPIPGPFFERQLAAGQTLQSLHLEKCEHEDDDWVVLKFDGPDPAISPFRSPK